jgi:hypothetical protein
LELVLVNIITVVAGIWIWSQITLTSWVSFLQVSESFWAFFLVASASSGLTQLVLPSMLMLELMLALAHSNSPIALGLGWGLGVGVVFFLL